jgi:hypothetical protein
MNEKQLQSIQSLPYVVDSFKIYDNDEKSTFIVVQCTTFIDVDNRQIFVNFWDGVWKFGHIQFQDIEMRRLEGLIGPYEDGIVQSELLHATYLYGQDSQFDTSKGLIGIYLNLDEWNQLMDSHRRCNDLQKAYILTRHSLKEQPCQDLDEWRFTDSKDNVWAMMKSIRDNHLY